MKKLKSLKVFLIGLGQIGGSIGYNLVKKRLVSEVIGFDKDPAVMKLARRHGAIDRMTNRLEDGFEGVDMIILATPIQQTLKLVPAIAHLVDKDALVIDVASTKSRLTHDFAKYRKKINYIGGHPIAGTEKTSFSGAEIDKFKNTVFILTPSDRIKKKYIEIAFGLVKGLEAEPLMLTAEAHDHLVALTSQLPYVFSLGLMNLYIKHRRKDKRIEKLIGGSFKSATRVALSSPELTFDMFLTNHDNVADMIDELIGELVQCKEIILNQDKVLLKKLIRSAKNHCEKVHHLKL
jgi:prephenate dehydrogenase